MPLNIPVIVMLAACVSGCDIIGPSCVSRQKTGRAASANGQVAAGQIGTHRLAYATEGSQNNIEVRWSAVAATPPRVSVYATRAACSDFVLPADHNSGDCGILARGSVSAGLASLMLTHGRGNPEVLGTPPEYTLWIVNDDERDIAYTVIATWFYGPDC
jgi:hypothetical protein